MSGSIRRRVPWWVLALLFVVLPVVEIYVLIRIGQTIGAWWTVLLLVADGFLGSWLMKREGTRAWAALTTALQSGRMPTRELADGALILVGGTLLLTPGFVSDIAGLFCILPLTRPLARRGLTRFLTRKLLSATGMPVPPGSAVPPGSGWTPGSAGSPGSSWPGAPAGPSATDPRTRRRPGPDSVVQGEVID
jgi:UPF0716 protein FxsA